MRTSWVLAVPILLTGVGFLAVALDLNLLLLNAPPSEGARTIAVQLGNVQMPLEAATLLNYLFLVIGLELVGAGLVIGLRRTPPQRGGPRARRRA